MKDEVCAIWAFDPQEDAAPPSRSAIESMKEYRVFPVAVLPSRSCVQYEKINSYLKSFEAENFEEPTILPVVGSRQAQIAKTLEFAVDRQASLIALTSPGKAGLEHFFLGTFAERLLEASNIPILFLTAEELNPVARHRAVFATDFSLNSKVAFQKFIEFAKHSVREIILFHANQIPTQMMGTSEVSGTPMVVPDPAYEEERIWDESEAQLWREELERPGIRLHSIVRGTYGSFSDSIRDICKRERIAIVGTTHEQGALEKQPGLVWILNTDKKK